MSKYLRTILLLISVAAVSQPRVATSTTTINGFPPYTLGAAQEAILKANPKLEAGIGSFFGELELSYQSFSGIKKSGARVADTTDYHGEYRDGAEGLTQPALISLQFYKGELAAVVLWWANVPHLTEVPREVQISTEEAASLYRRLRDKYGPPLRDSLDQTGGTRGGMIIRDGLGNLLIMIGINPGAGVGVGYFAGPFVKAVGDPP